MAVKKATDAPEAVETAAVKEVTAEAEKAVETANTASETIKVIYIGPTLPKAQLKTNKIIEGTEKEIKEYLKAVLEKYPLVEKMLVPIDKLAEKKDKVKTAGNILNKYYSDIVSSIAADEAKEG